MYKHPEWDVNPMLYEMYNLDRNDIEAEHQNLVPYMEKLEAGGLVNLAELNFSDLNYLSRYYYSRVGKGDYCHLVFCPEVRFDGGKKHWVGYVILPHVPSAEMREEERRQKERERIVEKRKKFLTSVMFVRELINLFFG